jgi:hypothetical protein
MVALPLSRIVEVVILLVASTFIMSHQPSTPGLVAVKQQGVCSSDETILCKSPGGNLVVHQSHDKKFVYDPTSSSIAESALQALQERLFDRLDNKNNYGNSITTHELSLKSMKESFDLAILTQFYDELMIPNFPLDEERDDLEDWLMYLDPSRMEELSDDSPTMDVLILTLTNKDTTTTSILGGIAFEYYPLSRAGLLSYMVISTNYRRLGILGTLHPVFCHALQALHQVFTQTDTKISAILAETNTADAGDVPPEVARKRHEILFRLGYRLLAFPYVQPPLAPGDESFDDIMLLLFVGSEKEEANEEETKMPTIPTQVLYDYVLDFYYSVYGVGSMSLFQDHWYFQLVTWYAQRYSSTIIQAELPWEDVTSEMNLLLLKEQQEQQQVV